MRYAILIATGSLFLSSCSPAPAPEPISVFMKRKVQPTATIYWEAVRFVSDQTGDHEFKPRTDAEWERTRSAAHALVAYGEILKSDTYSEGRNPDWAQFSQSLIDVAKQAEQAALERSADRVVEVGGTVYNVCSACHQIYLPATRESNPAR